MGCLTTLHHLVIGFTACQHCVPGKTVSAPHPTCIETQGHRKTDEKLQSQI